jgi:hypothetical protein
MMLMENAGEFPASTNTILAAPSRFLSIKNPAEPGFLVSW